MSTRILLIRHGETAWNREEIFRGRENVPLNDAGRAQARVLAETARREPLAAIYTSPLSRATETACAIADGRGLASTPTEAFTDIDCGAWQGRTLADIERNEPLYQQWLRAPNTVTFPGGESLANVRDRAFPAFCELALRHDRETIAIVAHRTVNKVILCEILDLGPAGFWRIIQSNACLNIVRYTAAIFQVALLNDVCHLERLGAPPLAADF